MTKELDTAFNDRNFSLAEKMANEQLRNDPSNARLWGFLGLSLYHQTKFQGAITCLQKSIDLDPSIGSTHFTIGRVLLMQGDTKQAVEHLKSANELLPAQPEICTLLGDTLLKTNAEAEGLKLLQTILQEQVHVPAAAVICSYFFQTKQHNNYTAFITRFLEHVKSLDPSIQALVLVELCVEFDKHGLSHASQEVGQKLLPLAGSYQGSWLAEGIGLYYTGAHAKSLQSFESLLASDSENWQAYMWASEVSLKLNNYERALHDIERAIQISPHTARLHRIAGRTFNRLGRVKAAEACFFRALALEPTDTQALSEMATIFIDHKEAAKGFRLLQKLTNLDPNNRYKIMMLLTTGCQLCAWHELQQWYPLIGSLGTIHPLPPWSFLALEDDPENQQKRAKLWSSRRLPKPRQKYPTEKQNALHDQSKIRIGYLSADFHDHATMHLIEGMVRCHDRQRFEFVWISYGKFKSGKRHRAIKESGDEFLDLQNCDEMRAVELIRDKHLDIAIDLKGYTQDERTHYFQEPIAPIHIQYLGYPGTLGSKHFDYLIADPVVIPQEEREHYDESVIFLPHSYQPNDDRRPREACKKGRQTHKLPSDGFIMCCFNQSIKIQPTETDIWLNILQKRSNTYLWMLRSNDDMISNLRVLAESYGISPSRLIFAKKVPQREHLARHIYADVCVDTFFYNAHTTASDSLWMGTPFITKAGRQFGARVCASLLTAVDLEELITYSNEEYQSKILELIDDPEYLEDVKRRLNENIRKKPLFDTLRFTRNFEKGLEVAHERLAGKLPPSDIYVADLLSDDEARPD